MAVCCHSPPRGGLRPAPGLVSANDTLLPVVPHLASDRLSAGAGPSLPDSLRVEPAKGGQTSRTIHRFGVDRGSVKTLLRDSRSDTA